MSNCLSDSKLLALNEGLIEESEIEQCFGHLESCEQCSARFQGLNPSQFEREFRDLINDVEITSDGEVEQCLSFAEEFSAEHPQLLLHQEIDVSKSSHFKILAKIGRGHFFDCVRAHYDEISCDVAIKIPIDGRLTSANHIHQFLNDASVAFQLDHPNIVSTLEFGRWDGARWFVATELLPESALRFDQWLQSDEANWQKSLQLVEQICSAIYHAHELGSFHRHLDFSNLFVSDSHVLITDFGFSFDSRYQFDLYQEYKSRSALLPPEFWSTEKDRVDHRSDVYSIGTLAKCCSEFFSTQGDPDAIKLAPMLEPIFVTSTRSSRRQRFQSIEQMVQAIRNTVPELKGFCDAILD